MVRLVDRCFLLLLVSMVGGVGMLIVFEVMVFWWSSCAGGVRGVLWEIFY